MVWSKTASGASYDDSQYEKRVPLPKFQNLKTIEQTAIALGRANERLRVHVVCAGFLYGNGEQNDIFYDFFRSAWVSLHPDLAALPIVGKGDNIIPTIHVTDLSNAIELILTQG